MKPGRGKSKGSGFERLIAKRLSLWITDGRDSTQLIRSVLSGGWSRGQKEEGGWRHVGDLAPNGPIGERFRKLFAVECKHQQNINLYGLWTRGATAETIIGWWAKLMTDSAAAQVSPMLIFRSNCMPIMVGMKTEQIPTAIRMSIALSWQPLSIFPFEELMKLPATPMLY